MAQRDLDTEHNKRSLQSVGACSDVTHSVFLLTAVIKQHLDLVDIRWLCTRVAFHLKRVRLSIVITNNTYVTVIDVKNINLQTKNIKNFTFIKNM